MRVAVTAGAYLAWVAAYFLLFPVLGAGASVLVTLPVAVTAYLWGVRGSIVATVLSYGIANLLWMATGVVPGETVVRAGSGIGSFGIFLVALGLGYVRDLNRRMTKLTGELMALRDAARAVSGAAGRDDALATILNAALRVVPARVGTLWLAREDELEAVAVVGTAQRLGRRIPVDDSIPARAYRTRETQLLSDARNVGGYSPFDPYVRAMIAVPITTAQRTLGVITVASDTIAGLQANDAHLLETFASNAAGAMQTHDLITQLRAGDARLRGVLQEAPVAILSTDRRATCTYAGGSLLGAVWPDPGPLVGHNLTSVFRVVSPGLADAVRAALDGETGETAFSVGARSFRLRYAPLQGDGGAVGGMIGVAVDA